MSGCNSIYYYWKNYLNCLLSLALQTWKRLWLYDLIQSLSLLMLDIVFFSSFYSVLIKLCILLSFFVCIFYFSSSSFSMFKYICCVSLYEFLKFKAIYLLLLFFLFRWNFMFDLVRFTVQTRRNIILSNNFRKIVQIDAKHFDYNYF